ncbi:hypothetical protein ILUMI_06037, partial [Ignelater luminosus]
GNLEERRYSSKPTDSVASTDVGTTSDQPKNPMEFFELMWTDELLNHIKAQTIQYATETNANSLFQISINEIRASTVCTCLFLRQIASQNKKKLDQVDLKVSRERLVTHVGIMYDDDQAIPPVWSFLRCAVTGETNDTIPVEEDMDMNPTLDPSSLSGTTLNTSPCNIIPLP